MEVFNITKLSLQSASSDGEDSKKGAEWSKAQSICAWSTRNDVKLQWSLAHASATDFELHEKEV